MNSNITPLAPFLWKCTFITKPRC